MSKEMIEKDRTTDEACQPLRRDLAQEFKSLRSIFRDIISRYQADLEADMAACVNLLSTRNLEDLPPSAQRVKDLRKMLRELQELKVKPRKGRLKDVRRVDKLVDEIYSHLLAE